jgi:hypothetical protein
MAGIGPRRGPEAYKSYIIAQPLATHWRKASCEEISCPDYLHGWKVRVEGLPANLLHAARTSGRRYRELPVAEGETWLVFEAGQACFRASEHRTRIGRPPLFVVRDGDTRGNPRRTKARLHQRAESWRDDFAEHQQTLADAQRRG